MDPKTFPTSQGQLIKTARGLLNQKQFAAVLKVDRSCLSRYENEQLGAPTSVLNHCLRAVAASLAGGEEAISPVQRALEHVREAVSELESATQGGIEKRKPRVSR